MEDDYTAPARRGAPLIQAALALLVAGTLVSFSVLAFRTGFAEDRGTAVTATDIGRAGGAVVLPALGSDEAVRARRGRADTARVAITTDDTVVLGTRVGDAEATTRPARAAARNDDHRGRGRGHQIAPGRGHDKGDDQDRDEEDSWDRDRSLAREEDDAGGEDGEDRDDTSDDSRSGSGRRDHRSGKRHGTSRGHSQSRGRSGNSN